MTPHEFQSEEILNISGRGTVIVIEPTTDLDSNEILNHLVQINGTIWYCTGIEGINVTYGSNCILTAKRRIGLQVRKPFKV